MILIARYCSSKICRKLGGYPVQQTLAYSSYTDKRNNSYAANIINESEDVSNDEDHTFDDDQLDKDFVDSVMTNSLRYVNIHGWSMDAVIAGATEVAKQNDMNTVELASSMFTEDDLVRFFIAKSNTELENFIAANKVNYHDALEYRLQKVVPYAGRYNEAIALSTQPKNIAESIRQLQEIADSVAHYALADKSTDISWYSKRIGLATIYASTELCLVQDKSVNFGDTWTFLRRRCQDFENMKLHTQNKTLPLPEILTVGFTTVLNMLQRNARR